jgi:hypothetical protein
LPVGSAMLLRETSGGSLKVKRTAVGRGYDMRQSTSLIRRVALLRTDVSEECMASIIRVTRIAELGTELAVRALF